MATNSNCGCGNNAGCQQSGEFIMVKATPSDAGLCGIPGTVDPTKACAKQEKMFDYAQSGFLVPLPTGETNMLVCNAGIYTTNMWLQFFNPVCTLKIQAITDQTLTLINRCPGGAVVGSNPAAGVAIPKGTKFVVCGEPNCSSNSQAAENVVSTLESLNNLPVTNINETSATDVVQPVGHVRSNPTNPGVPKVIKRIYGILMKAGTPVLSALKLVDTVNLSNNHRRLVIHKETKEVFWAKNKSEQSGLNTNTKYVDAVFGGAEALMPTMLSHFGRKFIEQNVGHGTDPTTWPTLTNSFIKSYNMLTEMPVIANLRVGTEYVVLVRVDVAVMKTGTLNSSAIISLNGARAGVVRTGWNAAYTAFNSVVMPVRVKKSDHQLTIKIESVGTVNYYYGIQVDAIFY